MDHRLIAFCLAAALLIVVPGPSVVLAVGRALSVGRRRALAAVVGNELGLMVQVAAVAGGLGALVTGSAVAFTVLKLAGAAYLVVLGVNAIRHRHDAFAALGRASAVPDRRRGAGRAVLVAGTARTWFARSPRRLAVVGGTGAGPTEFSDGLDSPGECLEPHGNRAAGTRLSSPLAASTSR